MYKRKDKAFNQKLAAIADAKVVTMTIDEHGDAVFLKTPGSEVFLGMGEVKTRRASHVEPANLVYRLAFHVLRLFGDDNKIADWTRQWPVVWRVNTAPVGGPILQWSDVGMYGKGTALWLDRAAAIAAEVKFLNEFFGRKQ